MVTDAIVRLRGLTKRFGEFTAVSGIDLDARAGEILALLGPNGAGKTTTIRMLTGILRASAGEASIAGLDCFRDRVDVMRHVGYLPDEPVFYDYLRGSEIVTFVGEMHGMEPEQIDRRAGALIERLGLGDDLEEYAVNYSHGMKKKLAAVCALLHDPAVLVMDEPTNGLDPFATRTMHEIMRTKAREGKAVFFSTHLLDQAEKLCHRVAILHNQRLAAVGRLEDLREELSASGSLEEVFFAVAADEQTPGEGEGQ
ncbi:MAG: ABC transporter ATP-binding protein [Planctomycetota bacterium]|jgi:ABC-2 type transport system ATP-binding protein